MKNLSSENLKIVAMIDLANMLMMEEKKALDFHDAFERIAKIKGFSEEEKADQLIQFYTDLNVDGRFMTVGSNVWGLKRWYPVDQIDDEVAAAPAKKRKKASKSKDEDEEDFSEDYVFDEEEEEEPELEAGFDGDEEEEEEELEAERIKDKDFDEDDDEDEANVFAEGFDIIDTDEEEEEE